MDPTANNGDGEGRSIEEFAANGETSPQEELFPMGTLEGDERTLANLTKGRGSTNIELMAALSKAEVPLQGGLVDPHKPGRAIVHYRAAEYKERPIYEEQPSGEDEVVGWKFICSLKARYVEPLGTDEEAITRMFERFMIADIQAANELADKLVRKAAGKETLT